jgi:hypothetical protein
MRTTLVRMEAKQDDPNKVSKWTTEKLGEQWPTQRWWKYHLHEAVAAGALTKRGGRYWGRATDIERWLVGELPERGRRPCRGCPMNPAEDCPRFTP